MKLNFYFSLLAIFNFVWSLSASDPFDSDHQTGEFERDILTERHIPNPVKVTTKSVIATSCSFEDDSITQEQKDAILACFRTEPSIFYQNLLENNTEALELFSAYVKEFGIAFWNNIIRTGSDIHIRFWFYRIENLPSKNVADFYPVPIELTAENRTRTGRGSEEPSESLVFGGISINMSPEEFSVFQSHHQVNIQNLLHYYATNNRVGVLKCFSNFSESGYSIMRLEKKLPDHDEFNIVLSCRKSKTEVDELINGGVFDIINQETNGVIHGFKLTIFFHYFHPGISKSERHTIKSYIRARKDRYLDLLMSSDFGALKLFYDELNIQSFKFVLVIEKGEKSVTIRHYLYKNEDGTINSASSSNHVADTLSESLSAIDLAGKVA